MNRNNGKQSIIAHFRGVHADKSIQLKNTLQDNFIFLFLF